jgi:hypothetical protein
MARHANPAPSKPDWSLLLRRALAWLVSVLLASEATHLLDPKGQWSLYVHILVGVVLTLLLVPLLGRLLRVPLFRSR